MNMQCAQEPAGWVHSIQTLGAVDGPGLRCVVFMQGCPLRCAYCHNPDTWSFEGGQKRSPAELAQQLARYKPYFAKEGGVTVSGGEPLAQAEFVAQLFQELHALGIHTALDTSGAASLESARKVLRHTDLVLADLKFSTEQDYRVHCKGSLAHTLEFLALTQEMAVPIWIRHVVAPGLTDTTQSLQAIYGLATGFDNVKKIEWLPYHSLCKEKYQKLQIPFAMADALDISDRRLAQLLEQAGIPPLQA